MQAASCFYAIQQVQERSFEFVRVLHFKVLLRTCNSRPLLKKIFLGAFKTELCTDLRNPSFCQVNLRVPNGNRNKALVLVPLEENIAPSPVGKADGWPAERGQISDLTKLATSADSDSECGPGAAAEQRGMHSQLVRAVRGAGRKETGECQA